MESHQLIILCVQSDPVERRELASELAFLKSEFALEFSTGLQLAKLRIEAVEQCEQSLALVLCENELSDGRGSELLSSIKQRPFFRATRKLLISGQPEVSNIIDVMNSGALNYLLTKPWNSGQLRAAVIDNLSSYVIKSGCDLRRYIRLLDTSRLLTVHVQRQISHYQSNFLDQTELSDAELSAQLRDGLYQVFSERDEGRACRRYSPNHILTKEGQDNAFLWFIAEGEVKLIKRDSDHIEREVVYMYAGSLIGGMSFIQGEKAFSTSVTVTDCEVIKLDRANMAQVIRADSKILPVLTQLLMRQFNRRLQTSIRTEIEFQQALESLNEAYQKLFAADKMATLGQLVAGIAHELNNPVAAISRSADTLAKLLPQLEQVSGQAQLQELSASILNKALTATPVSTAELRQQARAMIPLYREQRLARSAVTMGLGSEQDYQTYFADKPAELATRLQHLEHYHQVGLFLRNIRVCSSRIADLVKSLKHYASQDTGEAEWLDVHEGLEDTLLIFENRLKHLKVEKIYRELPLIQGFPIALQQVWTNLVSNALDAMKSDGELVIETHYQARKNMVEIVFQDNGQGMSAEVRDHIFELNYTTKREGHFGLGVGLTMCEQIIQRHLGEIEVESQPGKGSRFKVSLPVHKRQEVSTNG